MRVRGSVLVLAIFFLFVVELLALAFGRLVPVELMSAGKTRLDVGATLAAEAGIEYSLAWMGNELSQGREPVTALNLTLNGTVEGWTWEVLIEPDARTPPRGTDTQRVYNLTARGLEGGRSGEGGRTFALVRAAAKQESFARYARFIDDWPAGIWVAAGPAQIEGLFHTNDVMRVHVTKDFYENPQRHPEWPKGSTFKGKVTAHGDADTPDGVVYDEDASLCDPVPYGAGGKPIRSRYRRIYNHGRPNLQTGAPKIPLPDPVTISALARTAYGGPVPAGRDGKVYLRQDSLDNSRLAGVYVNGPASQFRMTVEPSTSSNPGVFIQEINCGAGTYRVVETHGHEWVTPLGRVVPKGNTVLLGPDGEDILTGLTNGLVFVNGDIDRFGGTYRGAHTVVAQGDVTLANASHLLPADVSLPNPSLNTSGDNMLGVVCRHFIIPPVPRQDTYLYAALLCHIPGNTGSDRGGLVVQDYGNVTWGGARLTLVGSLVEERRYAWGSITDPAGYSAHLHYDSHLRQTPPPNYPCSPRMVLERAAFESVQ